MQFEKHVRRGPDQRSKDAHHEGQPHKRLNSDRGRLLLVWDVHDAARISWAGAGLCLIRAPQGNQVPSRCGTWLEEAGSFVARQATVWQIKFN